MRRTLNEERPMMLTLDLAEKVIGFEYWQGRAFTVSGRLSQWSGLHAYFLEEPFQKQERTAVLELPRILPPGGLVLDCAFR